MSTVKAKFRLGTATAIFAATALLPGLLPIAAVAQDTTPKVSTMIPEAASETIEARIQSIDMATRQVTLAAVDGRTMTVIADEPVSLDNLRIGDEVTVHYYRSVAFLISKAMATPTGQSVKLPAEQAELLSQRQQAQTPGGVNVPMSHVTGLVVGIRPVTNTVEIVNPTGGAVYAIQASDPSRAAMLASLKPGDTVTAIVSPPVATSINLVQKGSGVKIGVLTCDVASGWGFVFGSTRDLKCSFTDGAGNTERYAGHIDRFGVDIGYHASGIIAWAVFAPTSNVAAGALAGNYVGVTGGVAFGVGANANLLVGGSSNTVMLQPLSLEGATGVNVAAGVGQLGLMVPPT